MSTFERLLVGPSPRQLEEALREARAILDERVRANPLPWPLPGLAEVQARYQTDAEGRQEWLSGSVLVREEPRTALAVAWWHDFTGRPHVRLLGRRGRMERSAGSRLFGPADDVPALSWVYPGRCLSRSAGGRSEVVALCDCGVWGPLEGVGWMGTCCAACHDRRAGGEQLPTGSAGWTIPLPASSLEDALLSPDGTALGGRNAEGLLTVWQAASGKVVGTLPIGKRTQLLALSFGGTLVALWGPDEGNGLAVWDVSAGTRVSKTAPLGDCWTRVAFTPDGTRLILFDGRRGPLLWEPVTGSTGEALAGQGNGAYSYSPNLAVSPDGTILLTADGTNGLRQWDLRTRQQTGGLRFPRVNMSPPTLTFSPDGSITCVGLDCAGRNHFLLWDIRRRKTVRTFGANPYPSQNRPYFGPGGRTLLILNPGWLELWDLQGDAPRARFLWRAGELSFGAVLADGRFLTACADNGAVRLWPVAAAE
jgi:hypothetical protein